MAMIGLDQGAQGHGWPQERVGRVVEPAGFDFR